MKRALCVLLAFIVVFSLILIAPVQASAASPVTLKVTTMYGEGDGNYGNYKRIIRNYMTATTNVTIEHNDYQANEETRAEVNADFAAGNLPDVIYWFTGPSASALMGKVVSVDDIRKVDPNYCTNVLQNSLGSVKEAAYGMKAYAIPTSGFWEGLYVNEKLLSKYGLAVPRTWDQLINVCRVLSKKGIVPIAQGMADEPHYLIELLLASGAGEEYQKVPTSAAEVPQSWVTGLNGLKLLQQAGAFPLDEARLGHGDAVTMFTEGKSAMIADGSWRYNILRFCEWDNNGNFVKNSEKWDDEDVVAPNKQLSRFVTVVPMPTVPGGNGGKTVVPGGSYSGWYITTAAWNNPAKRTAAINFVKYMCNDENIMNLRSGYPTNGANISGMTRPEQEGYNLFKTADLLVPPVNDRVKIETWNVLWQNAPRILSGADAKDILEAAFDISSHNMQADTVLMRLNNCYAILVEGSYSEYAPVDPSDASVYPFTLFSKTVVPVRFIEQLGASVKYSAADKPVTVTYGNTTLTLVFDSKVMKKSVNGGSAQNIQLPTAPTMVEGKTCVPIREIAEGLGFSVYYDSQTFSVIVSRDPLDDNYRETLFGYTEDNLDSFVEGVRGIQAVNPQRTLSVGGSLNLSAYDIFFDPAVVGCERLLYRSENPAVASVTTRGKVTALAKGTAKIIVSSHNGKEAVITVTVK